MQESQRIIPVWDFQDKLGEMTDLSFATTINDKIREMAAQKVPVFKIELPRLYRQFNEKGKKLREEMKAAIEVAGFETRFISNLDETYWDGEDDYGDKFSDFSGSSYPRIDDEKTKRGKKPTHVAYIELDGTPKEKC